MTINNWADLNVVGRVDVDALTVAGTATINSINAATTLLTSTPPAAADSTGTTGTITYDADFIYVCIATDTWVKAAIATWV